MSEGPTLRGELRRGVNAYNLTVGALASLALGALAWGAGGTSPAQALLVGVGAMVAITLMHTAAHAWFGWRFERGLQAHREGRHAEAVRLLRAVEGAHMDHYDEDGIALRALQESRRALEEPTR